MEKDNAKVYIYGKIGYDKSKSADDGVVTSHMVIKDILGFVDSGLTEIDIFIDSMSAENEDIFELLTFFKLIPAKINIYALGSIMNEAVWLLFGATGKRVVSRLSRLKICEVTDSSGFVSVNSAETYYQAYREIRRELVKIISNRAGCSEKELTNLLEKNDYYIEPEEAKRMGLIDEII